LKEVKPIDGAILIKGDIQQEDTRLRVLTSLGDKADLVLSDLAPNVSGIWDIDHARQIELTRAALSLTRTILRKGGNAIFKVFDGEFLQELRRDIKRDFSEVVLSKPKASRQQSSELYLVCKDFLHN
jgi:23S rRNA (uridine2552-2'-O)-methyltransferase